MILRSTPKEAREAQIMSCFILTESLLKVYGTMGVDGLLFPTDFRFIDSRSSRQQQFSSVEFDFTLCVKKGGTHLCPQR